MPGPVSDSFSGPPSTRQNVVTCVFCGHQYPEGTPAAQAQLLYDHVLECPKHPAAQLRRERDAALEALETLRAIVRGQTEPIVGEFKTIGDGGPAADVAIYLETPSGKMLPVMYGSGGFLKTQWLVSILNVFAERRERIGARSAEPTPAQMALLVNAVEREYEDREPLGAARDALMRIAIMFGIPYAEGENALEDERERARIQFGGERNDRDGGRYA